MTATEPKQPVAVVAESLMRTCYDEANRLANHGSNGLERMVMCNLYEAANEAKARLGAAADESRKSPPAEREAFAAATGYAALRDWLGRELRKARRAYWRTHPEARSPYLYGQCRARVAVLVELAKSPLARKRVPHTKQICNTNK